MLRRGDRRGPCDSDSVVRDAAFVSPPMIEADESYRPSPATGQIKVLLPSLSLCVARWDD